MSMFVGIVAILILLLVLIFVRRPKEKEKARPIERRTAPGKANTKFHAVSLKSPPNACNAAKAMEGERILSADAPLIPLADCDSPSCKCRFVHHKDRRAGDDRRNPWAPGFGGNSTGSYEKEQRKSTDRRTDSTDDTY